VTGADPELARRLERTGLALIALGAAARRAAALAEAR